MALCGGIVLEEALDLSSDNNNNNTNNVLVIFIIYLLLSELRF